ncbi:hypothetical protein BO82DRAFT_9113 [Aspergillus uvarum CBS 121591]|uniref:Uncharacterized protein n=1 Tax=Aspergillus uvarum CBS 121591 TaxID=1448315 RepID=A0A319CFN4_9EURO|nr:hypothetical protein BO82DRAFT_9113 [Aspergillus uvarum CBS 121591]PYH84666.1 hypothetical protein BO82DRAFT_9113 [Aspergillus uvarum CBS 121591]
MNERVLVLFISLSPPTHSIIPGSRLLAISPASDRYNPLMRIYICASPSRPSCPNRRGQVSGVGTSGPGQCSGARETGPPGQQLPHPRRAPAAPHTLRCTRLLSSMTPTPLLLPSLKLKDRIAPENVHRVRKNRSLSLSFHSRSPERASADANSGLKTDTAICRQTIHGLFSQTLVSEQPSPPPIPHRITPHLRFFVLARSSCPNLDTSSSKTP